MSLLTILQSVADEVKIGRPASVIGNTDPEAQTLLRLANKVGNRFMKIVVWQELRVEHTFTSLASETQTGILPAAFDRFIPETFWNRSAVKLISGPITPVEWQGLKASSYNGPDLKFIYRGGSVAILPQLSAGQTLAFEYVSKNWCQSSGGTGQSAWAADTDTAVLNEELLTLGIIFAYLTTNGQPNGQAKMDLDDYGNALLGNNQPSAGVLVAADIFGGARHFSGTPIVDFSGALDS